MTMAYSGNALRASALHLLRIWHENVSSIAPGGLLFGASLAALVACRLLPASSFQGIDSLIGRSGDALLLLAVLLLVAARVLHGWRPNKVQDEQATASLGVILDIHLQLDQKIDEKLGEVVDDTERSALSIMQQVRQLYDTAGKLVTYLDGTNLTAGDLGEEIADSMAYLVDIGAFIAHLPGRMERDLQNVQIVAQEIKALGGLVEAVQAISMQSHLLAINAAIEASRAGSAGAAFRVVADEVRNLASNSNAVASRIADGLSRAHNAVEQGMASGIKASSQQLGAVSNAAESIRKLQGNLEDMSQYYKTRFADVTKHNEDLAADIAEVLGQIQYQDVVRQCIERIRHAMANRNAFFQNAVAAAEREGADLAQLPELLEQVLGEYLTEEMKHKHSAREAPEAGSELKIELF